MKRILVGVALLGAGLLSLAFVLIASPLNAAMRADRRAREESDLEFDPDDPGYDVDEGCPWANSEQQSCPGWAGGCTIAEHNR